MKDASVPTQIAMEAMAAAHIAMVRAIAARQPERFGIHFLQATAVMMAGMRFIPQSAPNTTTVNAKLNHIGKSGLAAIVASMLDPWLT